MPHRHFSRRLAGAALVAAFATGATPSWTAVAQQSTTVPFSEGFESGSIATWPRKGINGGGNVAVTAAPGGSGKAARFTMPDDGQSYRSEIATSRIPYGSYQYSFSNYVPSDWTRYPNMTIVSQWHGGAGTIPAIALAVKGDRWVMRVHWKVGSRPVQEARHDLGPVRFGHWNRWSFDITWSTAATPGAITVRRDGVTVGSHRGPNSYHQQTAPYHKIGLYRPNWKAEKGHVKGGTPDVVIYYDDIRITKGFTKADTPKATPVPSASGKASSPARPVKPSTSASATERTASASPSPRAGDDVLSATGAGAEKKDSGNLAQSGASSDIPRILAAGGVLLAVGSFIVVRHRIRHRHGSGR